MKIRVAHNILVPAVSQIARYISAKPDQPALSGMILETFKNNGKDYLRLVGYAGSATAKTVIEVAVEEEGKILVAGHLFADVIRDLPAGDLTLDTAGSDSELKINAIRGVYSLKLLAVEDFPALPLMPSEVGTVDASLFASAVTQVSRAAAKDGGRHGGVLLEFAKDTITLVATDTYRMARRTIPWEGTEEIQQNVYIDAKGLSSATSQFARSGQVRIAIDAYKSGNFGIASDTSAVILQQGENPLPPQYGKLFVEEFTSTATVPLDVLLDAAKRIGKFAIDNSSAKFSLSKNQMVISANQAGTGGGVETIEIDHNEEEFEIFFNPGYLVDGLNALGGDQAKIGFNGPSKAATLLAQSGQGTFTYLVMPVRDKSAVPASS